MAARAVAINKGSDVSSASAMMMTDPAPRQRRPRVLQVITKLDLGGAESVAIDLIGALHREVDFGVFGVFALSEQTQVGRDMAARLRDWRVPFWDGASGNFKKGGALVAAWRLARAVKAFRADVVHLHTEVPELTYALATLLSPGLRRVGVLRTVHNCELWIAWGRIGGWVTQRLSHGHAIAVSQAAADADCAIPTRTNRTRPTVVYNGVIAPSTSTVTTRAPSPVRLLFAARLVPAKGSDLLPAILASAHAGTTRRDVEVTIAGTGPQDAELRHDLQGIASGWTVRMVPPIEQLGQRLGEWDVVLMPSRFEGLGLLAIEAFMAGVPLATTTAPGLAEVLPPDYPYSAAVDDAQALGGIVARLIDDPAAAREVVAPLRQVMMARFSPEEMVQGYRQAYVELAGGGA